MSVVSVLNYKGGVGKTTVTANLGADLAHRGWKVLLIDLDPQSSLTFSFYSPDEWAADLAPARTIMHWYDSFSYSYSVKELSPFITTPPAVNERLRGRGGRLDLIASDLRLVDVDMDLAAVVGGARHQAMHPDYLRLHRLLTDAFSEQAFRDYDITLIDCPPNFNLITRTAVVASDYVLIPAKADYLSTLGIDYLRRRLSKLVEEFNGVVGPDGARAINPVILGVVFTMIQYAGPGIMTKLRQFIDQAGATEVPVFQSMLRESKSVFADSGEHGVPAVLGAQTNENVHYDLQQLTNEFIAKIRV
ncbi:chromosome partitioning protein [Allocatelliglobosispora scoriae]|uniref:Chromosome partitioning protein n=1 Tax=Allocatelliglobosispora scoriae TaxID=643052 RepID=A0A841BL89_9ACTN|nr:AAA family ATPase [Allocatelliglobosispora scoriae]MBB5867580.1 chromosome partitioning protein [Allocatelliglobosispora scoriae]